MENLLLIGQNWKGETDRSGTSRINDPRDLIRIEVETALERNIPVIPILVHGIDIPQENDLPASIRNITFRQVIRLRSDPDFHRDTDRLVGFLRESLRAG